MVGYTGLKENSTDILLRDKAHGNMKECILELDPEGLVW